jgi:predicted Zn-dependent peptidase
MEDIAQPIIELSNGLRILYYQAPSKNARANLVFDSAGSMASEMPGLAHFAEHMVFQSALYPHANNEIKAEDYMKKISPWFGATTWQQGMVFSGTILPRSLEEYFNRLTFTLTNPNVNEAQIATERGVIENEILDREFDEKARFHLFGALPVVIDYP